MPIRSLFVALALIASLTVFAAPTFKVSFNDGALGEKFSGRVVIYFTKGTREPRFGPNWFRPEPMAMVMFKDHSTKEPFTINLDSAVTFPKDRSKLEAGTYSVQAVIDRNLGGRTIGSSPGNLYSTVEKIEFNPQSSGTYLLICTQKVAEPQFRETETTKLVRFRSPSLTKFYGRPTDMFATVTLPEGYETDTSKRYPTYYSVPGFGGNYMSSSGRTSRAGTLRDGEQFIVINLDASCPTGHSVFADSANNGPWGKALTEELIPHIDKTYRTISNVGARFVGGHSSGGWSSLWLQVTYPKVFGGCWSTAPDPIDFRDFQQIDLYAKGANVFRDAAGNRRPLARRGDQVSIWYEDFCDMERPIRGEQIGSFDGVFSPKGADGEPMPFFDRMTGAVDPKVIEHWKKYDIGMTLRTKTTQLVPALKGKMHVYMGNEDTFYLEGATKLVKKDVEAMGNPYEAKIEIFPGDHGTVMTPALRGRIDKEMADAFRRFKATQPLAEQLRF